MVSVQASRFALLKIDDDVDDDNMPTEQCSGDKDQSKQQAKSKKKNKKKKDAQETKEVSASSGPPNSHMGPTYKKLRNIAFGGVSSGKGKQRTRPTHNSHGKGSGEPNGEDWDLWKQQDEEFTAETYEKELQQAILESKLQFEQQKQVKDELEAQGISINNSGKQKKKKKGSKPAAMTLDQFRQLEPEPPKPDSSDEEPVPEPESPSRHIFDPDSKYFKGVSEEVMKILQKEKIQEKYQKQYAAENARTQRYQEEIDKKDKELEQLRQDNKSLKDELKQVKKRNQQLCHILSQGEMKDKTKILMELEELRQVRDELTQEVSQLNIDLQKERSKSRHAQGDNSKSKGGKHK